MVVEPQSADDDHQPCRELAPHARLIASETVMAVAAQLLDHIGIPIHDDVVVASQSVESVQDQPTVLIEKCPPGAFLRSRIRGVQKTRKLLR
jgi:hypothetical protein